MIKTEQGHCRMFGSDTTVMVDYIVTTEAMKDMLMKDKGMSETQAKDKILELIETAFVDKNELESRIELGKVEVPEKPNILKKIRKWRERK